MLNLLIRITSFIFCVHDSDKNIGMDKCGESKNFLTTYSDEGKIKNIFICA